MVSVVELLVRILTATMESPVGAAIPGKPQLCRTGTEEGLRAALKNLGLTEKAVDDTVRQVNETGTSTLRVICSEYTTISKDCQYSDPALILRCGSSGAPPR